MNRQTGFLIAAVVVAALLGATAMFMLSEKKSSERELPARNSPIHLDDNLDLDSEDIESGQYAQILESLINTLNEEIKERRMLAQQLEEMQEDVNEMRRMLFGDGETEVQRFDAQSMEDRFSDFGFTSQDREEIQRLQAAAQIRAIELDDLARREGWLNTARYTEEMQALAFDNAIRDELGDARYDQYMYAMGRTNRLVVGNVMALSAAEKAGFQRGDVIVRYGGDPVYSTMHMVNLRSSGTLGETVIVEIVRNGQPMQLTMPRGPMGLGGQEQSIDPRTNYWPVGD